MITASRSIAMMMDCFGKAESLFAKEEKPCWDISKEDSKMMELGLEIAQTLNLSLETSMPTNMEKLFIQEPPFN